MEFNENLPIDPIPEFEPAADPVIEEEAPQAEPVIVPVAEEEPVLTEDTGWHGVGQREEVFAEPEPQPEPVFEPAYERTYTPQPEEYTVPKRREKKTGSGKKVLAGILAAAVMVGSCAVTAGIVNRRWEERMEAHQTQVSAQFEALEDQLQKLEEA